MSPIVFGLPERQADFEKRNAKFFEVWPRLQDAIERGFSRTFTPADRTETIVYSLGRLVVEDFMEIILVCANGYGIAGLKLLRPMFEATVTARYLNRNPGETDTFLQYYNVHQRKGINLAKLVGIDVSAYVSPPKQNEIESAYQAIKHQYRWTVCKKCRTDREAASWTKKSLVAMAREVGLGTAVVGLYYLPTMQIHTTAVRLNSRFKDTPEGVAFQPGPQLKEADRSLAGAHACLMNILEEQEQRFGLGLDVEALKRDFANAWSSWLHEGEQGA